MQMHHLALRVADMEKSLHFYQTLTEMKVVERFDANPGECAYIQDSEGGTMIELICQPTGDKFEGKGMFLCFGTNKLDAAHARAVAEGINPSDIRQPGPNARYFYVYDPDGVSVQLREY